MLNPTAERAVAVDKKLFSLPAIQNKGADVAIVYLKADQPAANETAKAIRKEGRLAMVLPGDVIQ